MKFTWINRSGVGQDLKRTRIALGLSLADAAARAGVAPSYLWTLEKGKSEISFEKFLLVCGALAVPPARIVGDNLSFDRERLLELARRELGEESPQQPAVAITAEYASGCAFILIHTLLETADAIDFSLPGKKIEAAITTVAFKLKVTSTASERSSFLDGLRTRPVSTVHALGLMTKPLLKEFGKWFIQVSLGSKAWQPWIPKRSKYMEDLLSRSPTTALDFDPQMLGEVFQKLRDKQLSHLSEDARAVLGSGRSTKKKIVS